MDSAFEIIIRNKRIYEYYKKNTGINIETMNLILLDLMERLSIDMTALLQNTFQGQLLSEVKDVKQQLLSEVKEMRQQITSFHDSLSTRINKTNEEFIEKTKLVFSLSTSDNKEHMTQLLNRNSDMFIERLNSIIPKTNEEMNKKIQDQLSLVHKSIQLDIQQYLNKTDTPLTEFISSFDSKLSSRLEILNVLIRKFARFFSFLCSNCSFSSCSSCKFEFKSSSISFAIALSTDVPTFSAKASG
jgi:hypothetical protein